MIDIQEKCNGLHFSSGQGVDTVVTIERVAQRAGVSVATVSRTLNNSPAVKPATAQRVRQAVEALGYVPNQSARNLRRNESQVILALAPNFSNPYYSRILTGIGDRAWELEYSVLVCNTLGHANSERRFLKMMESHQADGAILLGCHWDYSWLARFAQRSHIVQCCEYVPDLACPSVSIDNYAATREMVAYLQRLGHRRIAMIGADNQYISTRLRRQGYLDAMEEGGLEIREDWYRLADADYSFASGQTAAQALLAAAPRPTAIFCVSDILALSAIAAAQELGLSVPGELTVTGFDDLDYTTMMHPHLTTVAQPCHEMGRQSVDLLLDGLLDREEPSEQQIFLPYRLMERESAAAPDITA